MGMTRIHLKADPYSNHARTVAKYTRIPVYTPGVNVHATAGKDCHVTGD